MSIVMPQVALMYDFDKTLSTHDMQDYAFIPSLGQEPAAFWDNAYAHARQVGMESILAYMYWMMRESRRAGKPLTRENLHALGKSVVLFPGVSQWFDRMNEQGLKLGLLIKHYIISSGIREIIQGTSIAHAFEQIHACEFHYDENGEADWPANAVNYTGKTQYLFRVNKGVPDITNDEDLNRFMTHKERPVPFERMIFIGDGLTDIPIMQLTKMYGGRSIAVYTQKESVMQLLRDGRVDAALPADYREGGEVDTFVINRLKEISAALGEKG